MDAAGQQLLHTFLAITMVAGCVWAAVAHRQNCSVRTAASRRADLLMLVMCLAMADLALGMILPRPATSYLFPAWIWGSILLLSTPLMVVQFREVYGSVTPLMKLRVLHQGGSMAAMSMLIFLAHGSHDHESGGGAGGHDHAGSLQTLLDAGYLFAICSYGVLSVALSLRLIRQLHQERAQAKTPALRISLKSDSAVPEHSSNSLLVTSRARLDSSAPPEPVSARLLLHEVVAQTVAVAAMVAML